MEQSRLQKATTKILNCALGFQVMYMLWTSLILLLPRIFLRMSGLSGLSGTYDLPCDWIHLGSAAVGTIIFALIYVTLTVRISHARRVGAGMGVLLGIYTYGAYFIMETIVDFMFSRRLNMLVADAEKNNTWTATIGENVAGASILNNWCDLARVCFFTAIVLLLIAYGVYCYHCKEEK